MLKLSCVCALFAISLGTLSCSSARAETFSFSATDTGTSYQLFGTLTGAADPGDAQAFDVTSGSVTVDGGTTLALVTPGAKEGHIKKTKVNGYPYQYDDILFPTGTDSYSSNAYVDLYGLLFSNGTDYLNLYFQNGVYVANSGGDINIVDFAVPALNTVTPEPSSIALLGTGLLGVLGVLRRRIV